MRGRKPRLDHSMIGPVLGLRLHQNGSDYRSGQVKMKLDKLGLTVASGKWVLVEGVRLQLQLGVSPTVFRLRTVYFSVLRGLV